jgi:hypothetical protein
MNLNHLELFLAKQHNMPLTLKINNFKNPTSHEDKHELIEVPLISVVGLKETLN